MTPLHSEEFIGFTRILLLLGLLYSIVEDSMILKKQKYSNIHMTFSIVYPSIVHWRTVATTAARKTRPILLPVT